MRRICAAQEIPDESVNWPVSGHLESRFELPWGPGTTQLGETGSCRSRIKLFVIVERKNICAVQAKRSPYGWRFRILKSTERRLSPGLDYLVCQSVSKNLSRLPNGTFDVYLTLARLCDALWNVHMHC